MSEQKRLTDNLRAVVTAYQAVHPVAIATVSRLYFGDSAFLRKAFNPSGVTFRVSSYDTGLANISRAWPDGATWPPTVERPPLLPARAQN